MRRSRSWMIALSRHELCARSASGGVQFQIVAASVTLPPFPAAELIDLAQQHPKAESPFPRCLMILHLSLEWHNAPEQ
jgi:hypothetical protein